MSDGKLPMERKTTRLGLAAFVGVVVASAVMGQPPPPATAPTSLGTPPSAAPSATPTPASPSTVPSPELNSALPVTPPPATAPSPPTVASTQKATGLVDTFWVAFVQELPKLFTALFVAGLAWFVGARITAAWDLRKKRGEFDILLAKEFYTLVATFKAVAREWEAHLRLKPVMNDKEMVGWETARVALARRALDAETNMETVLLKLVTEGICRDGEDQREVTKRQRRLALFRTVFRNLRETVEQGQDSPPGWGHPEFWLFNRLAGEISRIVYERSVQVPRYASPPKPSLTAQDFIQLLAGRTTDLRWAARQLLPAMEKFFQQRALDRAVARRKNVERLLKAGEFMFVNVLAQPESVQAPPGLLGPQGSAQTVRAAVEVVQDKCDLARAPEIANALFAANRDLQYYLILCNEPARLLIFVPGRAAVAFEELDELDQSKLLLPWSHQTRTLAADFLAWQLSDASRELLTAIATTKIDGLENTATGSVDSGPARSIEHRT